MVMRHRLRADELRDILFIQRSGVAVQRACVRQRTRYLSADAREEAKKSQMQDASRG
jgi:hypothetical protein